MWPYSAEENEWLNPLRSEPDSIPPVYLQSDRVARHMEHARQLRADAIAAFMHAVFEAPRHLLSKVAQRLRGEAIGASIHPRNLRTRH